MLNNYQKHEHYMIISKEKQDFGPKENFCRLHNLLKNTHVKIENTCKIVYKP